MEAERDPRAAPEDAVGPDGSPADGEHADAPNLLTSDRLEEYLDSFHRLTGIRSRLVIESDSAEVTAHDSLGDVRGVEFTESSWLVMPSVRMRLAVAPASGDEERRLVALLRESASRLVASETEARFFSGELADRYEEIDLLTSVGEILGSVVHLERAVGRLLARLADVLNADGAAVWVPEESESLRRLAAGGSAATELTADPEAGAREWID